MAISAQRHDVLHAQACSVGRLVVRLLLAESFGFHPREVVLDFALPLRIAPAENFSHKLSDYRRGRHTPVPGLDGNARPPGQYVLNVPGAFMAGSINGLSLQVVIGS